MPTYTVRDPKTGRTVKLTGDSPPTAQELEQVFGSLPAQTAAPPSTPTIGAAPQPYGATQVAADLGIGAAKGAANTSIGLGDLLYRYVPGLAAVSGALEEPIARGVNAIRGVETAPGSQPVGGAAFAPAREMVAPTNTAQKIGFGAEQIGEFFIPVGAAGKLGKAAEVAKAGGLTLAQGGSGTSAGVSAGITAAIPAAGALAKASKGLQRGAEKTVAQALGATKEGMKAEAARIAPQMLERGVKGSRKAMLQQADDAVKAVGAKIGAEIDRAAQAGQTVNGLVVRGGIQESAESLMVKNAAGARIPIEGTQAVVRKLEKLDKFVETLGDDIPFDRAAQVKQTWQRIVSKSGLYGQRATATATDNANAWATREAATAFKDMIDRGSPTLAQLNDEYRFWKGLKTVLTETERRTQAQSGGLISAGMGGAGAIAGAVSGDSMSDRVQNAVLGGLAGRQLIRVMQSPAWRTAVSAPVKHKLAEALASGNAERVSAAIGRVVASMPAQLREAPAP